MTTGDFKQLPHKSAVNGACEYAIVNKISVLQAFDAAHLYCIYVYTTCIFPSRMVWGLSQSKAWDWPGSRKVLGRVSKGFQQGSRLVLGRFVAKKYQDLGRQGFGGRFQQRNPLGLGERKVPNKVAGRFQKVLFKVDNRRNAQWILSPTDCSRCWGYHINVYS